MCAYCVSVCGRINIFDASMTIPASSNTPSIDSMVTTSPPDTEFIVDVSVADPYCDLLYAAISEAW